MAGSLSVMRRSGAWPLVDRGRTGLPPMYQCLLRRLCGCRHATRVISVLIEGRLFAAPEFVPIRSSRGVELPAMSNFNSSLHTRAMVGSRQVHAS